MHELGIATALQTALEQARLNHATRVQCIVIRVGALSGVDPRCCVSPSEAISAGHGRPGGRAAN